MGLFQNRRRKKAVDAIMKNPFNNLLSKASSLYREWYQFGNELARVEFEALRDNEEVKRLFLEHPYLPPPWQGGCHVQYSQSDLKFYSVMREYYNYHPSEKSQEDNLLDSLNDLLLKTLNSFCESLASTYRSDNELKERMSDNAYVDYSFEAYLLLLHIMDVILHNKVSEQREKIISHFYNSINRTYNIKLFDTSASASILSYVQDRMENYALVLLKEKQPASFWWFGDELATDSITQCLALFGDYVTYYRVNETVPFSEDVNYISVIDPTDCEALALPYIVFKILLPLILNYVNTIDDIIKSYRDNIKIRRFWHD